MSQLVFSRFYYFTFPCFIAKDKTHADTSDNDRGRKPQKCQIQKTDEKKLRKKADPKLEMSSIIKLIQHLIQKWSFKKTGQEMNDH